MCTPVSPAIFDSTVSISPAADGISSAIHPRRPTSTSPDAVCARTPRPWISSKESDAAGSIRAERAVAMIDRASGWFECTSPSAAACSSAAPSTPSAGVSRLTANTPVVIVPVLSNTTVSMSADRSRYPVCLIMMPSRAAAANAATIAVGLDSRSADGHSTTRIVIAVSVASPRTAGSALLLMKYHTSPATDSATGTKYAATCSIRSCRGVRSCSASRISWLTFPIVVSSPTLVARRSICPVRFVVPAKTCAPSCASTGALSPVRLAWLISVVPRVTSPSTGRFSPGRTRTVSPSSTSLRRTSCSLPSRTTRAVSGVRRTSCSIARCAPHAVRRTTCSAISKMNASRPAVTYSPRLIAARIASAASALYVAFPSTSSSRPAAQSSGAPSSTAPSAAGIDATSADTPPSARAISVVRTSTSPTRYSRIQRSIFACCSRLSSDRAAAPAASVLTSGFTGVVLIRTGGFPGSG